MHQVCVAASLCDSAAPRAGGDGGVEGGVGSGVAAGVAAGVGSGAGARGDRGDRGDAAALKTGVRRTAVVRDMKMPRAVA